MAGFGAGFGFRLRRGKGKPLAAGSLPALGLAASTVIEGSAEGTVIGGVTGKTAGSTLTLTDSAGGRFALSGTNLTAGATATDFETAASHMVTVRETLAGAPNSPRSTNLTINVQNVFEQPNLSALGLSTSSATVGTAVTIAITGATAGSAISGTLPDGLTLNSAARTITGTPTTAGSYSFTLTETLGDSANSPRGSTVSLTVAEAPPALLPLSTSLIIEGDSNTSTVPGVDNGSYAWQYKTHATGLTTNVRAQASRVCSLGATLNDGGNSLIGHFAEDMAYLQAGDLYTFMIGTNEMLAQADTVTLADIWAQADRVRASGKRVAVSLIAPMTSAYSGDYTTFNTRRAALNAAIRAGWASHADFLIPIGEHPDIDGAQALGSTIIGDGVHLTATGHSRAYDVYRAAVDSAINAARVGATGPTAGDWFASLTDGAISGSTTRRYIVEGLGMGVVATASLSSSDGATFRRGGGAFGTSSFSVVNGDVIELTVPHSASYSTATSATVTIGSSSDTMTVTTAANVTPADVTHLTVLTGTAAGASETFAAVNFTATGTGVFFASGSSDVTALTVGGVAATLIGTAGGLSLFTCPISATGAKDVVATLAGWGVVGGVSVSVVTNANAVPTATTITTPGSEANPHNTATFTIPANGIALTGFCEIGDFSATCNAPTTFIAQGRAPYFGNYTGVAIGKITSAGTGQFGSFEWPGPSSGWGNFGRGAIVFAAA